MSKNNMNTTIKDTAIPSHDHKMYDYRTGDFIGPATRAEFRKSVKAAETDGGRGIILLHLKSSTRSVYVIE